MQMTISDLRNLINSINKDLANTGYSKMGPKHIFGYVYSQLLLYIEEKKFERFDLKKANLFLLERFGIDSSKPRSSRTNYRNQQVRAIKLIFDYQKHGRIRRRMTEDFVQSCKISQKNDAFIPFLTDYQKYLASLDLAQNTIYLHLIVANKLLLGLKIKHLNQLQSISVTDIDRFLINCNFVKAKSASTTVYSIRHFIRFLYLHEDIPNDFSEIIYVKQELQGRSLPIVWSDVEIMKLLKACDRENATGMRDYAIILLALRTGLRAVDIINLKLDNLDWKNSKIILVQQKTKEPLEVPLTKDVGWAIIHYLRSGRPKSDNPYVFLRHHPPFEKISSSTALNGMLKSRITAAHLQFDSPHAMHSFRHTFATHLMNNKTPIPIICSLLGHTNVKSTDNYLRADIQNLRQCSLKLGDYYHE